jgi:hypothetical protein
MVALTKRRLVLLVAVAVIAVVTGVGAWLASSYQSPQVVYYNQAVQAYRDGKLKDAIVLFDESLQAYSDQSQASWEQRFLYGSASNELAALSHFHKGILLLEQAQAEKKPGLIGVGVQEIETALQINPGAPYASNISPDEVARLSAESLTVKHDLDLLFQKHPEQQANSKGQGQGQPGNGQPQNGQPQQAPNNNPGNKPGHGNNNQM